jgi:putative membrane protein
MRDQLANDRTFLAWLRTAIASMGLGVVVAKVALIVNQGNAVHDQGLYAAIGVSFVVCGAALVSVGFFQHRTVGRSLEVAGATGPTIWPLVTTLLTVAGAGVLAVLLGVTA